MVHACQTLARLVRRRGPGGKAGRDSPHETEPGKPHPESHPVFFHGINDNLSVQRLTLMGSAIKKVSERNLKSIFYLFQIRLLFMRIYRLR
jgi:hypothetical protein